MSRIFRMAWKDLRLMARDRIGAFFIIGFPIVMGVFFGLISGGFSSKNTEIQLAVVDEDNSPMSQRFVKSLSDNDSVTVVSLTRDEAINQVRRGRLAGLVAIPEGFGETAGVLWGDPPKLQIGVDPSRTAEAGLMEGMIMQGMGDLIGARFQDPASMRPMVQQTKEQLEQSGEVPSLMRPILSTLMTSLDEFLEKADAAQQMSLEEGGENSSVMSSLQLADVERIDVTRKPAPGSAAELVQKVRSPWDISFPQSMVWGVLACVAGFATLVVREQSLGTLVRLQAAPIPRWHILAGKSLACFISVLAVIAVMTIIGFSLGMRPRRWDLLVLAAVSCATCFVGIMTLVSLIGKTEQAVGGAAWGVNIVLAMFGGGMIPLAFMPKFMKTLSNFDPVKWGVLALEGAIWRDFGIRDMLLPCGVLLAVGVTTAWVGSQLITRRELG